MGQWKLHAALKPPIDEMWANACARCAFDGYPEEDAYNDFLLKAKQFLIDHGGLEPIDAIMELHVAGYCHRSLKREVRTNSFRERQASSA